MTRRLVLLRHGQTAWNAERRGQGHADVPLDETGRAQARLVAPLIAALRPDTLWSSDLTRAVETADAVAGATGLALRLDPRLREYDLGERTAMSAAEYAAAFPTQYAAWQHGRFEPVPGGETRADVLACFRPALADIVAGLAEGCTAVVVTHGAALRDAVVDLIGCPETLAGALMPPDNCGWAELVERDGWRLAAWNRAAPGPDFASGPGVG